MAKNILLNAFRKLWITNVSTVVNIASLSAGLTAFSLMFLYAKHEFSYDRPWPQADRIYRVLLDQNNLPGAQNGTFINAPFQTLSRMHEYFPVEIDKGSRIYPIRVGIDDSQPFFTFNMVEEEFGEIFQPEVVAGDLGYALQTPGVIAVEEGVAQSLSEELVVGQRIKLANFRGNEVEFEIGAVFKAPGLTVTQFDLLGILHTSTLSSFGVNGPLENMFFPIWLKLMPGASVPDFNRRLVDYVQNGIRVYDDRLPPGVQISDVLKIRLQALTDVHLQPRSTENGGDLGRVLTMAGIGLLVLLIACFNSIGLTLVMALGRRREIGVRKAIGAQRKDVLIQFLGESMLMTFLAFMISLALVELLSPVFTAQFLPESSLNLGINELAILAVIAVLVGLCCSAYPAFILSGVKPQKVLKAGGVERNGKVLTFRTVLVSFQFSLALILVILTLAFYGQLAVVREQPLGFDPTNKILALYDPQSGEENHEALQSSLASLPGVEGVSATSSFINQNFGEGVNRSKFVRNINEQNDMEAELLYADSHFFSLLDIPLVAGRNFDTLRDGVYDQSGQFIDVDNSDGKQANVILNRIAASALGFDNPESAVGEIVYFRVNDNSGDRSARHFRVEIVGIVEDNMYSSLKRRPIPGVYSFQKRPSSFLIIEYHPAFAASIVEDIHTQWESVVGIPPVNVLNLEDRVSQAYIQEERESRLLLICAGVSLLLSCFGLYGLVAYTMAAKVKEVGIRKALGGGFGSVLGLFLWRFSIPVLLANIIAWPVAVYFVFQWIERFPYQMEKIWLLPLCLGAGLLVLCIAILTVGWITGKAASQNPVYALRYE